MDLGPWVEQAMAAAPIPIVAALLVGVLASIGPCPLATNVVAVGYAARQYSDRSAVAVTVGSYALGRAVAYTIVGGGIVLVGLRTSSIARGLQDLADVALGPLLIAVGIVMLGVVRLPGVSLGGRIGDWGQRVSRRGAGGAFLLGMLFAAAFCPYSAALFFGVLVPMALSESGGVALAAAFGIGTSAPVLVLGLPLALGIERGASALNAVGRSEALVRRAVAFVFVAVGVILTLRAGGIEFV